MRGKISFKLVFNHINLNPLTVTEKSKHICRDFQLTKIDLRSNGFAHEKARFQVGRDYLPGETGDFETVDMGVVMDGGVFFEI